MKIKFLLSLFILFVLVACSGKKVTSETQEAKKYTAIHSGVAWFDQNMKEINAHGACIVKEGDRYYLFGEYKSDDSNAFSGFGCYSSDDLMNWSFEKVVLPVQNDGLLGPERVGERVKVMKCPATGEFVMYMHCDDLGYRDPHVGYATCKTIDGDYQFQGDLLFDGKYIKKWDLGTFEDHDQKGYLLTHEGYIYELNEDYKSVKRIVVSDVAKGGESPAMLRKGDRYFWMFSNKTSWERNDNYYLTATSLEGPWEAKGFFAPEGTLTWNSQCSFVFPIVTQFDTLYMYMGDRWSFPKQGSAATHVWQPIEVLGEEIAISEFWDSWSFDQNGQIVAVDQNLKSISNKIDREGQWAVESGKYRSNEKGAKLTTSFNGQQISLKGTSDAESGYARLRVTNSKQEEVINTIVDFYSKYAYSAQKFLSPILPHDHYTITLEVMHEHPVWSDKRTARYGSTDYFVTVDDVLVR